MASKKSAHIAKFKKVAKACQAKVKAHGKARFKALGKCMKAGFKKK